MSNPCADLTATISDEILSQRFLYSWPYFTLMLTFSFIFLVFSSYLGAYFSKRGQFFATKTDFAQMLEQTEKSTKAAEQARAEVQAAFGEASQKRNLLRGKIEDFFVRSYDLLNWYKHAVGEISRGQFPSNSSPLDILEMLQELYFSEASAEMEDLSNCARKLNCWMADLVERMVIADLDARPRPEVPMEEYKPQIQDLVKLLAVTRSKVLGVYASQAGI